MFQTELDQFNANPVFLVSRNWYDYERPFGVPGKEFWLGLDNMFFMTNNRKYTLKVTAVDQFEVEASATYKTFRITNKVNS